MKEVSESRLFIRMDKHSAERRRRAFRLDSRKTGEPSAEAAAPALAVWLVGPELSDMEREALEFAASFLQLGCPVSLVTRLGPGELAAGWPGQAPAVLDAPGFGICHVKPLESYWQKVPDGGSSGSRPPGSRRPGIVSFFLPLSASLAERGIKHACVLPPAGCRPTDLVGDGDVDDLDALYRLPDFILGPDGAAAPRRIFPLSPRTVVDLLSSKTPPLPPAPHVPTLSACLIARDEEGMIEDCLSSLVSVADEAIVNDTGSVDNTAGIAREYGALVFASTWEDDFSKARNMALDRAKGDYILSIDADERLAKDKVRRLKEDLLSGSNAYLVDISNELDGGVPMVMTAYRLFKRSPANRFLGRIHEQIEPRGSVSRSRVGILHVGYLRAVSASRGKRERNLSLLLESGGDRDHKLYYRYQIGVELLASGDCAGASAVFEEVYRATPKDRHFVFVPNLALSQCDAYICLGRVDDAVAFARKNLEVYPGFLAVAEEVASALLNQGRFAEAKDLLEKPAGVPSGPGGAIPLPKFEGAETYLFHLLMARAQAGLGDTDAALREVDASLSANPEWPAAQAFLVRHFPGDAADLLARFSPATVKPACLEYLAMGRAEDALRLASSQEDQGALGEIMLKTGSFREAASHFLSSRDAWDRERGACLEALRPWGSEVAAGLETVPPGGADLKPGDALYYVLNGIPVPRGKIPQALKLLGFLLELRALDRFSRALPALSSADDPNLLAGNLLYDRGYRDLAASLLSASCERKPTSGALTMLAAVAYGRKAYPEATSLLEQLREFRALTLDEYALQLRSLLQMGLIDKARRVLEDAIAVYPQNSGLKEIAGKLGKLRSL
jgi:glycosyltransferase involved in cell wall biosynthesis